MATANHSRPARPRARSGANRPRTHPKASAPSPSKASPTKAAGSTQRGKGSKPRPDFDAILGRFSDALAFVETASHALDAAEETGPSAPLGAELSTLRHGLQALRRVYNELDLAILALDKEEVST